MKWAGQKKRASLFNNMSSILKERKWREKVSNRKREENNNSSCTTGIKEEEQVCKNLLPCERGTPHWA